MTIKDTLDVLIDLKPTIYHSDGLASKLIRLIRTEIEMLLLDGQKMQDEYKPSGVLSRALANHPKLSVILNSRKPPRVEADAKLNGMAAMRSWADSNLDQISHLDYITLKKLEGYFNLRTKPVYWDTLKKMIPKKSKIKLVDGILIVERKHGSEGTGGTD